MSKSQQGVRLMSVFCSEALVQPDRIARAWLSLAVVVSAAGCVDSRRVVGDHGPGVDSTASSSFLIVSNPIPRSAGAGSAGIPRLGGSVREVAYVALSPGTVPTGKVAIIRNRRTGTGMTTVVVAGGFDPVPVEAIAGDTLEVVVRDRSGTIVFTAATVVAARRRPVVVRTNPPPGKRDVPLNATVVTVFSEPIDSNTLTEASIRLQRGTELVPGQLEFRDPNHLTVALAPEARLAGATEYTLVITQGVRDLDGDSLETPVTVAFTTESAPAPVASIWMEPVLTLALGEARQMTATAYDSAGNPLTERALTWSGTDPTVATVSTTGLVTGVSVGTAAVMAAADGKSATATINVVRGLVFATVIAGDYTTCGLTTDSVAYCWGGNDSDEVGYNSTPMAVGGGLRFATLSGVGVRVCGLTADGVTYCWGYGNSTPVAIAGAPRFSSLSAGSTHTCGVTLDGAAYCWGSNSAGELGDGTTNSSSVPVAVVGGLAFVTVSAGRGIWGPGLTCGVTRDGATYCWGYNQQRQLGTGLPTGPESCPLPGSYPRNCSTVPMAVTTAGLTFTTVRAGVFHACGLTASGTAYCWGLLGNWGTTSVPVVLPAEHVSGIDLFSGSVNYSRICLIATAGAAFCHEGGSQELGGLPVPGGIAFASVSPGNFHTCGVTPAGTAYCWGWNAYGQLGNGSLVDSNVPVKVGGQP